MGDAEGRPGGPEVARLAPEGVHEGGVHEVEAGVVPGGGDGDEGAVVEEGGDPVAEAIPGVRDGGADDGA